MREGGGGRWASGGSGILFAPLNVNVHVYG